jgi:two-component system response regulator CpxR
METYKILLIDDDVELCELLITYLTQEGFDVIAIHDGEEGYKSAVAGQFDVIVLDVMLPTLNGLEVLKLIQKESETPILMLTAKGDEVDRIIGLEIGADDYLAKPCNPRELVARLRAILRRVEKSRVTTGQSLGVLIFDDINLNHDNREVTIADKQIILTNTQFEILKVLMEAGNRVISKEELCEKALGRELTLYDRSLDMHISHLRSKIPPLADGEPRIKTIRGVGYMLQEQYA